MHRLYNWLRFPGHREELQYSAPTQVVSGVTTAANSEKDDGISVLVEEQFKGPVKPKLLDRWLDIVVETSGSDYVYFVILISLLVWAFLGIRFGQSDTYKIIISDAQAIFNMIFDAFLMRQQFNSHDWFVMVAASMRSRSSSHKRMLIQLLDKGTFTRISPQAFDDLEPTEPVTKLPGKSWLTRVSTAMSIFMGHIVTVGLFWVCIFIWIGFGPYCGWSNNWQLYINSATSALMMFMLAFLANVRERHAKYTSKCLQGIWKADSHLELRLRQLTGDQISNQEIILPARSRGRIQRCIDYYADLVGTLVGIAILGIVILIWIVCGPALHFNANWWLLIGTYAGLIGLNDGFVLRNICTVLGDYEDEQFAKLDHDDLEMLNVIGVGSLREEKVVDRSITVRISVWLGNVCSHEYTIVTGLLFILGLIIAASVMRWSETGQLLCNIPPSIIESFFTMILITGHNLAESKRRVDLSNVYLRRLNLLSYIEAMTNVEPTTPADLDAQQYQLAAASE